jgi:hypothetical protein
MNDFDPHPPWTWKSITVASCIGVAIVAFLCWFMVALHDADVTRVKRAKTDAHRSALVGESLESNPCTGDMYWTWREEFLKTREEMRNQ